MSTTATTPRYPPDGAMLLLLSVDVGCDLTGEGGRLSLRVKDDDITVDPAALDDLEARGWVEIGEAGARVTERGGYWLRKWMTERRGKGRFVRADPDRPAVTLSVRQG